MAKYKNVMIIDDDPVTLIIGEKLMKITNFSENVTSYSNGADALDYLKQQLFKQVDTAIPQMIFLDLNMPGINGWEFMELFSHLNAGIQPLPVLTIFSSTVEKEDKDKAFRYSFVKNFFLKPLQKAHLEIL
ncbi:MAG: response regulator [Panacibacter sp.]